MQQGKDDDKLIGRWIRVASMVVILSVLAVVVTTTKSFGGTTVRSPTSAPALSTDVVVDQTPNPTMMTIEPFPTSSPSPATTPPLPRPVATADRVSICPALHMSTFNVLCFGDSLTYGNGAHLGSGTPTEVVDSGNYPKDLKGLLTDHFTTRCRDSNNVSISNVEVFNLGLKGIAASPGPNEYAATKNWKIGLRFAPKAHVAIFMLGTNDAMPKHWKGAATFTKALKGYIDSLLEANLNMIVVVLNPTPVIADLLKAEEGTPLQGAAYYIDPIRLRREIFPLIRSTALQYTAIPQSRVVFFDFFEMIEKQFPRLVEVGKGINQGTATTADITWAKTLLRDGIHPTKFLTSLMTSTIKNLMVDTVLPLVSSVN